jgi:hypothetical protein
MTQIRYFQNNLTKVRSTKWQQGRDICNTSGVVSQIYSDATVVYPAPLIENSSEPEYNWSIKIHRSNKEKVVEDTSGMEGNR